MTLTIEECEASGGHHPIRGMGGVSLTHSLHWEKCSRCPAWREGMRPFGKGDEADIAWSAWGRYGFNLPPADSHDD